MTMKTPNTEHDDGGYAFPHMGKLHHHNPETGVSSLEPIMTGGMSLRDWFAGQALAGILENQQIFLGILKNSPNEQANMAIASNAYCLADAMLAARKERQ